MRSSILIFLTLILFSACSFKQEKISINHYGIDFQTKPFTTKAKFDSIFIEEPNINRAFNSQAIFYTQQEFKFEEYAKNRWISFPSNTVYTQLVDSFISSNIFANVLKDKKIKSQYKLKTEVLKMYQNFEDDKSYAILKIKFDLVKDEKIVKSFNFNQKTLCDTNDAYGFVKALNSSFEESLNSLLKDLLIL
ncbi:MAG: hypothetical protein WC920_05715 [Aliarcobacter sp.]